MRSTCTLGVRPCHRVQSPLAGNALELMEPTVLELEARSGCQIAHGRRGEHLTGNRGRGDAGRDRDGDAADLPAHLLDFADVDPGAELDADRLRPIDDLEGAQDRGTGRVEDGEEP